MIPLIILCVSVLLLIIYNIYLCIALKSCKVCCSCCFTNDDKAQENMELIQRHIHLDNSNEAKQEEGEATHSSKSRHIEFMDIRPSRNSYRWTYISLYLSIFCILISAFCVYFGSMTFANALSNVGNSFSALSGVLFLLLHSSQDVTYISKNIATAIASTGCSQHFSSSDIKKIANYNDVMSVSSNSIANTLTTLPSHILYYSNQLLSPAYIVDKNYYFYVHVLLYKSCAF